METLTDKTIYLLVRDVGLVRNQYEFSKLCGRTPTWFAGVCSRELGMSIASLGVLIANIAMRAAAAKNEEQMSRLMTLHSALGVELSARCHDRALAHVRN